MEHRVVKGRLCIFCVIGFFTTYITMACIACTPVLVSAVLDGWSRSGWITWVFDLLFPLGEQERYGETSYIQPLEGVAILASLLMPLTFVLLPDTLRRARVKRVHLVRVWMYGLVWFPVALFTPSILQAQLYIVWRVALEGSVQGEEIYYAVQDVLHEYQETIVLVVVGTWLFVWWWQAAKRYLRLPHSLVVAVCMLTVSTLVAMISVLVFGGGTW